MLRLGLISVYLWICIPLGCLAQTGKWTLKNCIAAATKYNVQLNQQVLASQVSRIGKEQAKENRMPTLNFTDAQNFSFGNTVSSAGGQVVRQNTNSNYPGLSGNLLLYSGFKLRYLAQESELNYQASLLDVTIARNNLSLNVVAAYEQILYSYEAVSIAQEQVANDSVQVDRATLRVAVGQTPEDSLLLLKAQLETDRAAKVTAQTQLMLANVALEQLMELPVYPDFVVETPEKEVPLSDTALHAADIYKVASTLLPDEKSAGLKTAALEKDLLASKSVLLPVLNLSAGLSSEYYSALTRQSYQTVYQNETIGYLQSNPSETVTGTVPVTTLNSRNYPFFPQMRDNFSQSVALSLTVPIFNNYKAQNNIRLAALAVENARLNEAGVKNTLRKNVETAYSNKLAGMNNYMASKAQLEAETRAYNDMLRKFKVGLVSVTDFLVEENIYFRSKLTCLQARYTYLFESKVVDFYLGKSLEE